MSNILENFLSSKKVKILIENSKKEYLVGIFNIFPSTFEQFTITIYTIYIITKHTSYDQK